MHFHSTYPTELPVYVVPQYQSVPAPSFGYDSPVGAMPLPPVVLSSISAPVWDAKQESQYSVHANARPPLNAERVFLVNNPEGVARTIHHHAAPRQLSLLGRLWNDVKTVVRFAVRLTAAAFKILWEVVKIALKILAYTLLGVAVAAVIVNPTPASFVALGVLAGLIVAADRPRCCHR